MPADFKQLVAFLSDLGIEQIAHTQKNYLAHLVNVYRLMERHAQREELCRAGLFHSIYGTEKFQGFKLSLDRREELAGLIGLHAERLAYWNCLMDRASLDRLVLRDESADPIASDDYTIVHRETGEPMSLTRKEFDDLCSVHLFDWLEQAPRSRFGLDYRRDAYRQMALRLGPPALAAYEGVFGKI
jgi:hypothetical protein